MTTQVAPNQPVMDQLKEATAELHSAAESHAFQRSFVKGTLTIEQYCAYLGQLRHVHEGVERRLRDLKARRPELAPVLHADHSSRLRADLKHFGADPDAIAALAPTVALIETIDQAAKADPLTALGYHYVLEGSMNGNRFIAMGMMRGMGLKPGPGLSYLDPYGERQRETWSAFKQSMNDAGFTQAEIDVMIDAACGMFRGITTISQVMPLS